MSTNPTGNYAAPLPAATPLEAAVAEEAVESGDAKPPQFTYAGKTFELVDSKKLLKSAYMIEKGAATDSLYYLVDGAAEMIVEGQRREFTDWLLEEASGEEDSVSLDGLLKAIYAAYEDATGRPLDKSGS